MSQTWAVSLYDIWLLLLSCQSFLHTFSKLLLLLLLRARIRTNFI
jgi:hypothetical protein